MRSFETIAMRIGLARFEFGFATFWGGFKFFSSASIRKGKFGGIFRQSSDFM